MSQNSNFANRQQLAEVGLLKKISSALRSDGMLPVRTSWFGKLQKISEEVWEYTWVNLGVLPEKMNLAELDCKLYLVKD